MDLEELAVAKVEALLNTALRGYHSSSDSDKQLAAQLAGSDALCGDLYLESAIAAVKVRERQILLKNLSDLSKLRRPRQ